MGTKFYKRNGSNGIVNHKIPPQRRKRRADAVASIRGDKRTIKAMLAKGRRRKGVFTPGQRRLRKDWLSWLRLEARSWDGVGNFERPIPSDIAPLLTEKVGADMTEEYSALYPHQEITITYTSFQISGGIRST
ncbi:MAG: hypothetical protein Q8R12_04980 [bacterium]|nr:hypothetical protein [bacterium]